MNKRPCILWSLVFYAIVALPMTAVDADVATETEDVATETEAETIEKALETLSSPDVELRRRSVLILGKYDHPAAMTGLTRALNDSSPAIRRSALVALTNQIPDSTQASLMLLMTADPDVSIRRIASSNLPRLFAVYRMDPLQRRPERLPLEIRRALSNAFRDADATVRKNMVSNWTSMIIMVYEDKELVVGRLQDEDRDVRVAALQATATVLSLEDFVERTGELINDPDRSIRFLLAQLLGRRASRNALDALRKLSLDKDPEVAIEAQIGLFQNGDASIWPILKKALSEGLLKPAAATRVIPLIPSLGEQGKTILEELMQHNLARYRELALRTYGQTFGERGNRKILLDRLNDEARSVREIAAALLAREPKLPVEQVAELAASPFSDVRLLALVFAGRLPEDAALDISLGLLIDEQTEVRATAVALIAIREFKGWNDILTDSLADPAAEVRQETVLQLLNKTQAEAGRILEQYLVEGTDESLKEFIRRQRNRRLPGPFLPDW